MITLLPAKKIRICDIVNGKFFADGKEGMKPSYVITQFGNKVTRVTLVGTVVDKFESEDGNYATVTIDDGSGLVRAKAFKDIEMTKDLDIGDEAIVIGKMKEYQGEVYVNLEVAKKVEPNYEIKHKLEVLKNLLNEKVVVDELRRLTESMSEEELKEYAKTRGLDEESLKVVIVSPTVDYKPKILEIFQTLDKGDGVEVGRIFEILKLPENIVEKLLTEFLDSGYIYEPTPGKLKRI